MIKLLERKSIKNYSFASYVIGSLQQVFAQGWLDDAKTDAERCEIQEFINEKYDLIEAYSADYCQEFNSCRILHLAPKNLNSIEGYVEVFTDRFEILLNDIGIDKVVIVLTSKCDWFGQKNNYKPVKESMLQLRKIVGDKHYYEAFEVETINLKQMTKIIFWLGRCNASLPHIHIISEENKINFMICKYGNLHAEIYSHEIDKKVCEVSERLGFSIIETEDEFLDNGIKGRNILI